MSKPDTSFFFQMWLSVRSPISWFGPQLLAALPQAVVGGRKVNHGIPRPWFRSWALSFLSCPWATHMTFLNYFLHHEVEKSVLNGEVMR